MVSGRSMMESVGAQGPGVGLELGFWLGFWVG